MRTEPLNPWLYRCLRERYGEVRIDKPGEKIKEIFERDMGRGGSLEWKKKIDNWGETYRICCPKCGDTRFRCYINHLWGHRDEDSGWLRLELVYCFNDDSCWTAESRELLFQRLSMLGYALEDAQVKPGREPVQAKIDWPGEMIKVSTLPSSHAAKRYLTDRLLVPERLERHYGVSYCQHSRMEFASDRLIIPFWDRDNELIGWQARYIGELPWKDKTRSRGLPPKYWSCPRMQRRRMLMNHENARHYDAVVLVEGPFDVFGVGPMAVASLGKSLSPPQRELLVRMRRPVLIALDPEETEQSARVADELKADGVKVAHMRLPQGRDPGSYCGAYLQECFIWQARKAGLNISFRQITRMAA